ncbi:MAG TPA: hypothetical protein VGH65_07435 [Verrucomicrobiaceae bacterium]|jgi:hypothetical protein
MSDVPKPEKKPIPREFHSEYEERPFRACSQCGEPLSAFQHYQINKAWRNGECVFEYVFCEVCRDRMLEEFSEESKASLLRHQEQHLRDVHGTGECAFCGRIRADSPMRDYVITALCSGDGLLDCLMICEPCQLQTHELLSEKTRDVRRRFFEDLPGVPPDWEGLPMQEDAPELVGGFAGGPHAKPIKSPFAINRIMHDPAALLACVELIWAKEKLRRLKVSE